MGWSSRNVRQAALFPALEEWHPLYRVRLTYIPGMQPSSPSWLNLQRVKAACTRFPHHPGNLGYSSVLGNVENKVPNNFSVPEPSRMYSPFAAPSPPQQGSTTLWVKSAGGGGTMQVARCREELRRVSGARGWVARRGPLPSVPPLGSGCSGFAWRPVPQRVGGGGKKW